MSQAEQRKIGLLTNAEQCVPSQTSSADLCFEYQYEDDINFIWLPVDIGSKFCPGPV